MSVSSTGAERTRPSRLPGLLFIGVLATILALGSLVGSAGPASASTVASGQHRPKIVIVVGATGPTTSRYRSIARGLASQARRYGANVIEVFSPNATWARVRTATRGANMLIYLGHGNGWPSRYAPFQQMSKDGLGLNASASGSDYNTEYYGEQYLDSGIHLAATAVVLLVHLCYASGAAAADEPRNRAIAMDRVDNYGAGFLRTGAKAVVAEGLGHAGYLLKGLFHSNKTLKQIFWSSPLSTHTFAVGFNPRRSPSWARAIMDPTKPRQYYRSIIGQLSMRASAWR